MIFSVFQKKMVFCILGPPYCGMGATIGIGREILCLPYAEFFLLTFENKARGQIRLFAGLRCSYCAVSLQCTMYSVSTETTFNIL